MVWKTPTPLNIQSIGVRKKSPYKRFLKQGIEDLLQRGQYKRYTINAERDLPICSNSRSKGTPLGLPQLASLFSIVVFGAFFSLIFFCLECCRSFLCSDADIEEVKEAEIKGRCQLLKLEDSIQNSLPYLEDTMKSEFRGMLKKLQLKRLVNQTISNLTESKRQ